MTGPSADPTGVALPASPESLADAAPFIARFTRADGTSFEGSLLELAAALRAATVEPADVPLLELTRRVLARFERRRADPSVAPDEAAEALPHLAAVIELKARLLLPKPPATAADEDAAEDDASLESVLEGVEALAQLEHAIAFLRDRRRERSRLLAPAPAPIHLPRRARPIARGLGDLVEAAKRRVREVNFHDLARDRLTLPQALERLRALVRRARAFLFHDAPAATWEERAVLFSALLEGVRAGELSAEQSEAYGPIRVAASAERAERDVVAAD